MLMLLKMKMTLVTATRTATMTTTGACDRDRSRHCGGGARVVSFRMHIQQKCRSTCRKEWSSNVQAV